MYKFTSISALLSDDFNYLKSALDGTRYKLTKKDSYYYAITYGEAKTKAQLFDELEGELISLGAYTIHTDIYYEPSYKGQ